jgi:hypothetical protein
MTQIKFTSDGKKVIVVGKLNAQQTIVQEVFVVGDQEIPSGENFVVTSLHDAPSISWKEKSLKDLEERYERERKEWDYKIDTQYKNASKKYQELKNHVEYSAKLLKGISPESFNMLVLSLTGRIKWIVKNTYTPELVEFSVAHNDNDYRDKLRLLSIFGNDDGTLTYAIGTYSDYSGGNTTIAPFENYEEALEHFKAVVISKGVNDSTIAIAKKYGFELPSDEVAKYKERAIKGFLDTIQSRQKEIEDYKNMISAVEKLN